MEFTVLPLILLLNCRICTGHAKVSLTVSPNRSQFFKYESVSLGCDEEGPSTGWRVRAKTVRGDTKCGDDWGFLNASSCFIKEVYKWNSGVYWCESTSGERGMAANITVTEAAVILESPVLPVMEGEAVTLRCTALRSSSNLKASVFFKDGSPISAVITGEMTIPAVSRSDEGLYMCQITDLGNSPESWLIVRGPDPPPAPFLSVSRLICHLVVGIPYLLSSIILGLLYRDMKRAQGAVKKRNCDDVLMEEYENQYITESGASGKF